MRKVDCKLIILFGVGILFAAAEYGVHHIFTYLIKSTRKIYYLNQQQWSVVISIMVLNTHDLYVYAFHYFPYER